MDAFESVVGLLFEHSGYWVKRNYKVELTAEEKRRIGRESSPRWELDIVAYKPASIELLAVECKSFLNSQGVKLADLEKDGSDGRYKLFTDELLRKTVLNALCRQLSDQESIPKGTTAKLGLATGKISAGTDRAKLHAHFDTRGWLLWDDVHIKDQLLRLAKSDYENHVANIVVKLLLTTP